MTPRTLFTTVSLVIAALALPAAASATFPGTNGAIAFVGGATNQCGGSPGCFPTFAVFTVSASGTGVKSLGGGGSPAWSPQGKLAYVAGGVVQVRSASLGKPSPMKLRGLGSADNLAWAANGASVYVRGNSPKAPYTALFLAGGPLRTAKQLLSSTDVQDVVAAPNGKQIAFISGATLYVANANGTGAAQVLTGAASVDWSPNGQQLVVAQQGAIWTMTPTGGSPTQITPSPSANGGIGATQASFTPDGTGIVYLSYAAGPGVAPGSQSTTGLSLMTVTGANPQLLVPSSTVAFNMADGPVMQPLR